MKFLKVALFILGLSLFCSCSNKTKKSMGLMPSTPDEYQLNRNKALEIPPHIDLPKPGNDVKESASKESHHKVNANDLLNSK